MIALVALAAFVAGVGAGTVVAGRRCRHRWTLQLGPGRLWLECPICGDVSPGWNLSIDNLRPAPRPQPRGALWPTVQ